MCAYTSPLGEGGGEGMQRLGCPRRLLVAFCSCIEGGGRELRPAAHLLFLLRQKELGRKRRPHWPCPFASLRATCGARAQGGAAELAAFASLTLLKQLPQARALSSGILQCHCPPWALRSSARPKGLDTHSGHCCARPANSQSRAKGVSQLTRADGPLFGPFNQTLSRLSPIASRRAKAGNTLTQANATKTVPTPPITTDPTGPINAAVAPDSNSPS